MKVFSMFDGVGGFIVGLERSESKLFEVLFANQYEPSRKSQDAFEVGLYQFPHVEHLNNDISLIPDSKFQEMKEKGVNMIVAGFPCQDYSVARSKSGEKGIEGKKGVLFWEIIRAVKVIKPDYLILENVDRLLKSPASQRGRDFGVMLATFNSLGYSVEWRVINAADYGMAQRRRRVFFFITKLFSPWNNYLSSIPERDILLKEGLFARQFPVEQKANKGRISKGEISEDLVRISEKFSENFWNAGIMKNGNYYSIDTIPIYEPSIPLSQILQDENEVDEKYYLSKDAINKFAELRDSKQVFRTSKEGHQYYYSEGSMSAFDDENLPGRTMLTSEGTINRSTHLIFRNNRYRLLTPIEAERLQHFEDDWTKFKKTKTGEIVQVTDRMRYFFMGNALVTKIVTRIANELEIIHSTIK